MRSTVILIAMLAFLFGSAVTATAASAPLKTLDSLNYVEDNAENLADGSVSGALADTVARRVATDWQALRTTLSSNGADESTLKEVDAAVAALAARVNTGGDLQVQANDVTGALAPLFGFAGAAVPWQINRLDYLGRAIGLEAKAGDWAKVSDAASSLEKTWASIRPAVISHNGYAAAQKFDAALDSVKKSSQSRDANGAAKAAAATGDGVDTLEGVFGG
jgi:hypothetical protein